MKIGPWTLSRVIAAGAATALCPTAAAAAACADALVLARPHENLTGGKRQAALTVVNAALGIAAVATGLAPCSLLTALAVGGAVAYAMCSGGNKKESCGKQQRRVVIDDDADVIDAEFRDVTDVTPGRNRERKPSEAILRRRP